MIFSKQLRSETQASSLSNWWQRLSILTSRMFSMFGQVSTKMELSLDRKTYIHIYT